MKIEKFTVEIERENALFVATITFEDNTIRVTQSDTLFGCYDNIVDMLQLNSDYAKRGN